MILPLPRTGPSSRCRLQLTTKIEVVELLAAGQRDRTHRLGLVHLAVAHECPHLAVAGVDHTARGQVLHEPGLVDRHQAGRAPSRLWGTARTRASATGAGTTTGRRRRPRGGSDGAAPRSAVPRGRRGRRCPATSAPGCRRGRRPALRPGAPEVVEADFVQRLGRLVARDVAAELGRLRIRLEHDRDRVPADERGGEPLELGSPGIGSSSSTGMVLTYGVLRPAETLTPYSCAWSIAWSSRKRHPLAAVVFDNGVDGVEPLPGLDGIGIGIGEVGGHAAEQTSGAGDRRLQATRPDPSGSPVTLRDDVDRRASERVGRARRDGGAAARRDRAARVGRPRSRPARLSLGRGTSAAALGRGGRLRSRRRAAPPLHEVEAQAGESGEGGDRRDVARRDRHPRPARKTGVHDAERLPAEGLRAGGPRRRAPRETIEEQHCYVCKQPYRELHHVLRPALPAVRRVQLREAVGDRRSRGPGGAADGRPGEDRLPGRDQAAARRART